jgi:BCD family chlorophyll transporter-like MFS transporter
MVVEMALPASLPAALVAWHYAVQLSRPRWGHGSDTGRRRTPWIIGGMGILALGALLAADATIAMADSPIFGVLLGLFAFAMIGAGVAASGTSLLALLATRVPEARRPAAAAIAWIMMIVGIVLTAGVAGHFLDPFSPQRLVLVASCIAGIAFVVSLMAVTGIEGRQTEVSDQRQHEQPPRFMATIRQIWREKLARDFTLFVFVSMLAYSTQELILEPFAGLVFGYSLGASTQLAGFQHGGVLVGMVVVGLAGLLIKGDRTDMMKRCTIIGCIASAAALVGLASAGMSPVPWPLPPMVFGLGLANGVFAVSALGLMMAFAGAGRQSREGIRVGVWGAAQAIAFGAGGFAGATGLDLMRHAVTSVPSAFAAVFAVEALCFLVAAVIASRLGRLDPVQEPLPAAWQESRS